MIGRLRDVLCSIAYTGCVSHAFPEDVTHYQPDSAHQCGIEQNWIDVTSKFNIHLNSLRGYTDD